MWGKEKVHSEKFRFEVKDEVEDFVSDEESKRVNGRWELAILLSFFGQQTCLGILIEFWVYG